MNPITTALLGVTTMIVVRGLPLVALWLRLQFAVYQEREHCQFVLAVLHSSPHGILLGEYGANGDLVRFLIEYNQNPVGGDRG